MQSVTLRSRDKIHLLHANTDYIFFNISRYIQPPRKRIATLLHQAIYCAYLALSTFHIHWQLGSYNSHIYIYIINCVFALFLSLSPSDRLSWFAWFWSVATLCKNFELNDVLEVSAGISYFLDSLLALLFRLSLFAAIFLMLFPKSWLSWIFCIF